MDKDQKEGDEEKEIKKERPCFEPSGILLEYYGQKKNGVLLKFSEPLDSANPDKIEWCLFEFIDDLPVEGKGPMLLSGQSSFLLGRDDRICDFKMVEESVSA